MDLGLKGKVAMVGGASHGLGFAVARALARGRGERVDRVAQRGRDPGCGGQLGGQTSRHGGRRQVGRRASSSWATATIEQFGGVDLLFANGGGPPAGPALSFDDAAWQDAANLLLFSTLRMVRAVVPSMTARGGGAILVSTSSSVKEPIPNLGLSTVLRASVSALAKTLALELAASRIRVNQIVPGRLDTDRVRELDEINGKKQGISAADAKAKSIGSIPLGRYGSPTEFGRVGAFLLSNAAQLHDRRDSPGRRRTHPERAVSPVGGRSRQSSAVTSGGHCSSLKLKLKLTARNPARLS